VRILLVLENAGAGSGRHVIDLAAGLLRRGHAVTLIYSAGRCEPWFEDAAGSLPGLERAQVGMVRGPHPSDLRSCLEIRRHIARRGPFDVIHGHSSKGGALARLAGAGTTSAVVYTPHAFYTLDPQLGALRRAWYATLERLLARRSDAIICVSAAERAHALALGMPERLLFEVHNRIGPLPPPNRERARAAMGLRDGEVCIGFVGRLAPQKGLDRLLRAFADVAATQGEARLAIAGSGPQEQPLRQLVRGHGLEGRVLFLGQTDGPAVMAGFDVFALASRYEAFPYVLLEAAQRGLPIVTTLVGGAREIVQEGVNGYVLAQEDGAGLAQRLRELCRDPARRAAMGRAGQAALGAGVDEMVDQTLAVYGRAVQAKEGLPPA
jgi:glycosyltransferase involved in cell wall biosynthesis